MGVTASLQVPYNHDLAQQGANLLLPRSYFVTTMTNKNA